MGNGMEMVQTNGWIADYTPIPPIASLFRFCINSPSSFARRLINRTLLECPDPLLGPITFVNWNGESPFPFTPFPLTPPGSTALVAFDFDFFLRREEKEALRSVPYRVVNAR